MSKFSFLFPMGALLLWEPLLKKWLIFLYWMVFAPFSVSAGHIWWVCFREFSLYYSTYMCVYPSANMIWSCLCSYTMVLNFNILIPLTILFQIVWAILLPLPFHTDFRIISSLSAKTKTTQICLELDGNSAKPMYPFGKHWERQDVGSSKACT